MYDNIGTMILLHQQDDFEGAMLMSHKGLAIRMNAFGEDHVDTEESYYNIYIRRTMYTMNDFDRALASMIKRDSANSRSESARPGSPSLSTALHTTTLGIYGIPWVTLTQH